MPFHSRIRRVPAIGLRKDMEATNDNRSLDDVARSYLAIPFLGPEEQVVVVFYADCFDVDFFADNRIVESVRSMCDGFCHLFDWSQEEPFPTLRNFPLQKGEPIKSTPTLYPTIQEPLALAPPKFKKVTSFNYEASLA